MLEDGTGGARLQLLSGQRFWLVAMVPAHHVHQLQDEVCHGHAELKLLLHTASLLREQAGHGTVLLLPSLLPVTAELVQERRDTQVVFHQDEEQFPRDLQQAQLSDSSPQSASSPHFISQLRDKALPLPPHHPQASSQAQIPCQLSLYPVLLSDDCPPVSNKDPSSGHSLSPLLTPEAHRPQAGRACRYLGNVDPLKGHVVLFRRCCLSEQLQQGVATVKVHVLLNAILLAQGQQDIGPAPCNNRNPSGS